MSAGDEAYGFLVWTRHRIGCLPVDPRKSNPDTARFKSEFDKMMKHKAEKLDILKKSLVLKLGVALVDNLLPGEVGEFYNEKPPSREDEESITTNPEQQSEHYQTLKLIGSYIYSTDREIRMTLQPYLDDGEANPRQTKKESIEFLDRFLEGMMKDFREELNLNN